MERVLNIAIRLKDSIKEVAEAFIKEASTYEDAVMNVMALKAYHSDSKSHYIIDEICDEIRMIALKQNTNQ